MSFITPAWDLHLFRLINETLRCEALDYIMPIFSYTPLAWALFIFGSIAVLLQGLHHWKRLAFALALVGITVGVTDISCNIIKHESQRTRPYQVMPNVHYMVERQWTQTPPAFKPRVNLSLTSFVSSHAANSMALTLMLMFLLPWTRPWLLSLPVMVGWSRVYLGKHYPLDVLAGYVVGALIALIIWYIYKRFLRSANKKTLDCLGFVS